MPAVLWSLHFGDQHGVVYHSLRDEGPQQLTCHLGPEVGPFTHSAEVKVSCVSPHVCHLANQRGFKKKVAADVTGY